MKLVATHTLDVSMLERFMKSVRTLSYQQLTYGFYDQPHYSGLTVATLAAIHQQGWGNVPPRPFMTSAGIAFNKDLAELNIRLFGSMINGGDPTTFLKAVGQAGADKIRFIIDSGSFPNNMVSPQWAAYKGFNQAMYHYGDLKQSATFKISKGKLRG